MSTIYAANGSLVSTTVPFWNRKAISGSVDGTPQKILCTGHGFNTGDTVEQEGVPLTPLNGLFQITKVDANSYTLNGTTTLGSSAGSGGYAIDHELQPAMTLPAGAELADPNVIGAAFEAAVNPWPFMRRSAGKYREHVVYTGGVASGGLSTPWVNNAWSINSAFTATTPTALANAFFTFQSLYDQPSIPPVFDQGDLLVINATLSGILSQGAGTAGSSVVIGVALFGSGPGILPIDFGLPMNLLYARPVSIGVPNDLVPIGLSATVVLTAAALGITMPATGLGIGLFAYVDAFESGVTQVNINLYGPLTLSIQQLRPNP